MGQKRIEKQPNTSNNWCQLIKVNPTFFSSYLAIKVPKATPVGEGLELHVQDGVLAQDDEAGAANGQKVSRATRAECIKVGDERRTPEQDVVVLAVPDFLQQDHVVVAHGDNLPERPVPLGSVSGPGPAQAPRVEI